ncbi:hypothetical protein T484DRAFT_2581076 [Baffinella frigidus]|nr:hypothetical protein T484DRAFT_2581076 [Cryptophyta sp. CCMP2293]
MAGADPADGGVLRNVPDVEPRDYYPLNSEIRTPPTVAFSGMVLVWNLGIISTKQALGGFSNSGLLAVGVLFVVVQSVERSGLPEFAARQIFGVSSPLYHTADFEGILNNP